MILVFLKPNEEEGQDEAKDEALIFAYTVHEFGAGEETTPKSKWTVLGYLDSNRYFVYAASIGYKKCQFWCATPGDDYYLFNDPMLAGCTRTSQKLPFEWRVLVKTNRGNFAEKVRNKARTTSRATGARNQQEQRCLFRRVPLMTQLLSYPQ